MEERGSYYYWHYAQATNTSKKSIRSILQLYRLTTNLYLMTSILRKKWSSTCAGNCYCIFLCILWIHSLLKHRKSWKCATCNTLSDTIAIFIIFSVQWIRCLHCRKTKGTLCSLQAIFADCIHSAGFVTFVFSSHLNRDSIESNSVNSHALVI